MTELWLAFIAALVVTLALGAPLIRFLRAAAYRQVAYEDAPKTHAVKTGTPTMGGLLFVLVLLIAALRYPLSVAWGPVLLGLLCGVVGFYDDFMKIRGMRNRGLRAYAKLALTVLAAAVFLAVIFAYADRAVIGVVFRHGGKAWHIAPLGWCALSVLVVLATTHAVNLTDGLDGLAAGTMIAPLGVTAWVAWQVGMASVAYVDVAVIGAALGFLAYNRHPAQLFMGDTGSLLLGGVLAGSVILTGTHLLLPLIGGVFVAEAASVILQVAYFKATRKRIFRMSPLHHHFELGGWPETLVTYRFCAVSLFLSLLGVVIVR